MTGMTRGRLLKYGVVGGTALAFPVRALTRLATPTSFKPSSIPKYAAPLFVLPPMPRTHIFPDYDYYEIAVRQFRQQVLPPGLPQTTVWGYGSATSPGTFSSPAYTVEATADRPVRVKWINGLVDGFGNYLPHLFTVDPTLHWANPPGGNSGRDMEPSFDSTPPPYGGPVSLVTHLHGAHSREWADGYPEAWFLPDALNIPSGYATVGSYYSRFKAESESALGQPWDAGTAVFQHQNDQRAATLWYHDHALGMTRLNVYAGLTGFYLLRGGSGDLPPGVLPDPARYEIPLVVQDRSFNDDGSLFYPSGRAFFDGFAGPYIGEGNSDIPPYWNPETFGTTIVVNGRTWPSLNVEARRYRFRILNVSQARVLILKLGSNPRASRPAAPALPIWQIGADGGFLAGPTGLSQVLLAPAERADVIIDFTGLSGKTFYLINEGSDEPFGGGTPGTDFAPADPATTGQVMKLVVGPPTSTDRSVPPDGLTLPSLTPPPLSSRTRRLSLTEHDSATLPGVGPAAGLLGIVGSGGAPVPKRWEEQITEMPSVGATETWELFNTTEDAHPIHLHLVQFQILNRQQLATDSSGALAMPLHPAGSPMKPESWETGTKDTIIAYPGQVARVRATFDMPGLFVWHCHILEHEDHEMMRPYMVG